MDPRHIVLVPSPFVGPSSLAGLARALRDLGETAAVPSRLGFTEAGTSFYVGWVERLAAEAGEWPDAPTVLVGHSGAGGLLPAAAEIFGQTVRAAIFVDAVLPHPGRSWFETAPAALASRLRSKVVEGRLPRWDVWISRSALARLIPDEAACSAFVADLPRVPEAFCDEPAPNCPRWPSVALGYLQLSEAYAAEADAAIGAGWIVRREPLHHLAPLTHPDKVAESLQSLIDALMSAA